VDSFETTVPAPHTHRQSKARGVPEDAIHHLASSCSLFNPHTVQSLSDLHPDQTLTLSSIARLRSLGPSYTLLHPSFLPAYRSLCRRAHLAPALPCLRYAPSDRPQRHAFQFRLFKQWDRSNPCSRRLFSNTSPSLTNAACRG
jgi:hypothetical protein